ncbi:hypothetical protein pb186bvf_001153 [Paramecium bursaria]
MYQYIIGAGILLFLHIIIYYIISSLHWLLIIAIFGGIYYTIIVNVIQVLVFPGSFYLYLRSHHNAYARALSQRMINHLQLLQNFLKVIETEQIQSINNHQIKDALNYIEINFQKFKAMRDKNQLNPLQQQYFTLLLNIINVLQSQKDKQMLKELFSKTFMLNSQKCQELKCPQIRELSNLVQQLLAMVQYQVEELSPAEKIKRWYSHNLLGTLDELRTQIILSTGAQRSIINIGDAEIDTIFISLSTPNNPRPLDTVLFCSPNGAFYEYLFFDSNWAQFYRYQGYSVILWNYRSYGQSTGKPTPQRIQEDCLVVANYYREKYNIGRFGIHGYSLGGSVASYAAVRQSFDFLILDRTFTSVGQIASKGIHPIMRAILSTFTNYSQPNYRDYCDYRGHKIIITDTQDEIIPYLAQMQVAAAKERYAPSRTKYSIRIDSILDIEQQEYENYFKNSIMPEPQIKSLIESLQRLAVVISKYQKKLSEDVNQAENDSDRDILYDEQDQLTQRRGSFLDKVPIDYANQLDEARYPQLVILVQEVVTTLQLIYANQQSLFELMDKKLTIQHISGFFACFYTYGLGQEQSLKRFNDVCNRVLSKKVNSKIQEYILHDLQNVQVKINKIHSQFSADDNIDLNTTMTSDNMIVRQNENAGQIVWIQGGHNSNLNHEELTQVAELLRLDNI